MTNATDTKAARAYAIAMGEAVGDRGRLDPVHVTVWEQAGRPVMLGPVRPTATGGTGGKRGGRASIVVVDGETWEVTKQASRNARAWAVENDIPVPARGRLALDVLQGWVDAGMPEAEPAREERATVIYRRTLDKSGRRNASVGRRTESLTVWSDQLPATKPRSSDYVRAVQSELPTGAVVERIITANTIIDVTVNDDGEYVYAWVSKADSRAVVNTLKANLLVTV